MSINAVIQRPNRIIANTSGLTTTQSNPPVSLRNSGVSQNYIHNMLDVVENNPQDGYTLVYNSTTEKYEVGPVVVSGADLDGGTF